MIDPEHAHLLLSPLTIQATPDGADNLNGLLTALLQNATTEPARLHQDTRVKPLTGTKRRSWTRAAWLFLRYGGIVLYRKLPELARLPVK